MPARSDIKSILIVGSGPIIIGQACEFDYSGTQACRVLKELGYRVILINSNPATIMTDPQGSDATYIEPITPDFVQKVIEKEKPDAILSTMGGQTALNVCLELAERGALDENNVEMIGANAHTIRQAEDRELFRQNMESLGIGCPRSFVVTSVEEAYRAVDALGFPAIIRPSFTLGGLGGGIVNNRSELSHLIEEGLEASIISQVLVEESLIGWKEFELEVIRDTQDNAIVVCSIENIDPMGVHTGDSITCAPALTLSDKEYQNMRDAALAIVRKIGINSGGSNVQFAVNPQTGRLIVIEMNPRVSRSSALASKATGYPIARVAAQLAVGMTLDEIHNSIANKTAAFEPSLDYVVIKIPRFAFEKFDDYDNTLTTAMRSVGEIMSIGRTFCEALQKAFRSLGKDLTGLEAPPHLRTLETTTLEAELARPQPLMPLIIAEALRRNLSPDHIISLCKYDPWFVNRIKECVDLENDIQSHGLPTNRDQWALLKSYGFSDLALANLCREKEEYARKMRWSFNLHPSFKRVDSCASEFDTHAHYMYSTYQGLAWNNAPVCEADPDNAKKVIIIGSGPNRIGQGIEFDYGCTQAAHALKKRGIQSIMVNTNPETVSTDPDTSDRLYFDPLTLEDLLEIVEKERKTGELLGVLVQISGETGIRLAQKFKECGVPVLGTKTEDLNVAEDRSCFRQILRDLDIHQPESYMVSSLKEAQDTLDILGLPVLVRPSYVLGGRAMRIIYSRDELQDAVQKALAISQDAPILMDRYLTNATEFDVDVIRTAPQTTKTQTEDHILIAGIMEHIEEAGVHSGDSACSFPCVHLGKTLEAELVDIVKRLADALNVEGFLNVQVALLDKTFYVLEANPRASRTIPFLAKARGIPFVDYAVGAMLKETLPQTLPQPLIPCVAVKEAVFPFHKFPRANVILGPEMQSTGEVMGIDTSFVRAFAKSQIAAGMPIPTQGKILISLKDSDKELFLNAAKDLEKLNFKLLGTRGTAAFLQGHGVEIQVINKVAQGRPHTVDTIKNGDVCMIFNTTEGMQALRDSASLRQCAEMIQVPYHTTLPGSLAMVEAIKLLAHDSLGVKPLQEYLKL